MKYFLKEFKWRISRRSEKDKGGCEGIKIV
jgi:hypothetical protein